MDVFIEGHNLGLSATTNSQGQYAAFADGTPNLLDSTDAGLASCWDVLPQLGAALNGRRWRPSLGPAVRAARPTIRD